MFNENNQKRAKTSNFRLNNTSKPYQVSQTNNFRDIYINQSPTYYNHYRLAQEEQPPSYMHQIQYKKIQNKPRDFYRQEGNKFQKTMKNLTLKPEYFFSEFNSIKDNEDLERTYIQKSNFNQKSVNIFTNQNTRKSNEHYYIIEKKRNAEKPNKEKSIIKIKEYGQPKNEKPLNQKKFNNNKPLIKKENYIITENKMERSESFLQPVAQKICNIIIKGEAKKEKKKMKSGKKNHKIDKFTQNIEIEENVSQGSAIAKKLNFKIIDPKIEISSSTPNIKYKKIEQEEKERIKNKEENNNGKKRKNEKGILERIIKRDDEEYEIEEDEQFMDKNIEENKINKKVNEPKEQEIKENVEMENEEGNLDERERQVYEKEIEEEQEMEEGQEQIEDDKIEQGEQIEQLEDDGEENIKINANEEEMNKGDIEELEEEEQQQIQISKNVDKKLIKKTDFTLQKENEITLKAIKEKKPLFKIEKFQILEMSNKPKLKQQKNKIKLKIINDKNNKVEIIGHKNPLFLEINKESNLEFIKKKNKQIIKIQRVESLYKPKLSKKKLNKKQSFKIIRNRENEVVIKPKNEQKNKSLLQIQRVKSFIQMRNKQKKTKNKIVKNKICKIKDCNFMLEKIEEKQPELIIEYVHNQQIKNKKIQNKKKNKNKFKISKIKDGDLEIISTPNVCVCYENEFEIQKKYNKMTSYKKLKQSKRTIYQYKYAQLNQKIISNPKDARFMIKAKTKKIPKKAKYIIRKEIVYYYKSPIIQKKQELTIGGKIKNTVNPKKPIIKKNDSNNDLKNKSSQDNRNNGDNNRKFSSQSTSNINSRVNLLRANISPISNIIEKKGENKENKKEQGKIRAYKTTTIVSSNLIKSENEIDQEKQEIQSIRKKYENSKSNSNIYKNSKYNRNNRLKLKSPPSSNNSSKSKDKPINTENNRNISTHNKISNIISPIKDKKYQRIEIKNENGKKNENEKNEKYNNVGKSHIISDKYDKSNKNNLNKSENEIKTQKYFSSKNSKNDIPKTPISNNYVNNNYNRLKNKSHTITIVSNNQESKNIGRTYITSNKLNQRNQSDEVTKTEEKTFSNVGRVYVSSTNKRRNNEDKKENKNNSSNSVNTIYISTYLKKDKSEDKTELLNNNNNNINNNIYFTSTFHKKKSEPKQFLDNNTMFISSRGASINKNKDINKIEIKTNINRIMVDSSTNSPMPTKTLDKVEMPPEPKNINKILNNSDISSNTVNEKGKYKKQENNDEEIKIISSKTEEIIISKKDINIENKSEIENKNYLNNKEEDKKDDVKNNFDNFNIIGNSQLSDITKSYLNSYISGSRPELSDFSKQFLTSNYISNSTSRPELSNITRAYLISQSPINEHEDEK